LETKVDVLKEQIELISGILEQNNLAFKEETNPVKDIENETFKRLEQE